jgi:hypothetical protein
MRKLSIAAALVAVAIAVPLSLGSSHREAPNVMLDPAADNTDTYAFTADDAPDALTVVANWVPGGNPANGPNFFRFDDRARYYISIDNTGDGRPDIRYRYTFKTVVSDSSYRQALPGVESFDDPKLLQKQRYSIVRETYRNGRPTGQRRIATDLPVAPSNAGPKTFPDYGKVAAEAIRSVGSSKYFAGQRDDAFFIDLAAAFDNINLRVGTGNAGGGIDTQAGTSTQTITMQVPEAEVTRDGRPVSGPDAANATVGVGPRPSGARSRSPTRASTATRRRAARGSRSRASAPRSSTSCSSPPVSRTRSTARVRTATAGATGASCSSRSSPSRSTASRRRASAPRRRIATTSSRRSSPACPASTRSTSAGCRPTR